MISATSGAVRLGARRVAPRAASLVVAPAPKAVVGKRTAIAQARRCLSSTSRLAYAINTNPNPPLGKKNASNDAPSRIGLIGARGYTGQALIDLLNNHPNMDLRHVSSRELDGQELKGYTKRKIIYENLSPEDVARLDKDGQVDCWIMALPNGVCRPFVEALGQSSSVIVDISADYRFDKSWAYGLPEMLARPKIAQSTRISTPGCYSTGALLALNPILEHLGDSPSIFGVSGYSGAGTKPSPKNDVALLHDNLLPYSLTGHMHEREINHQLGITTSFIPHCASWFRGIHLTINAPLNKTMTSRDIRQIYQDRYAGEKLVKVVGEAPLVRAIQNKHGVEIGGFAVDSTGQRVVVCATIDNLNKGAATQCLQNMNLALGYDEYQGVPLESEAGQHSPYPDARPAVIGQKLAGELQQFKEQRMPLEGHHQELVRPKYTHNCHSTSTACAVNEQPRLPIAIMKLLSVAAAITGLLSPVMAAASQSAKLPADFKPPQVFKNANLVHVISLEKNYAKEQINVAIENVSKEPQDEYYIPFTASQIVRVGGFEVKDRKDENAGPFAVEVVEYDPNSDVQYFRIRFPSPLKAGAQQTIGITYFYLDAYRPLPASIEQDEAQYLVHDFSVFAPSAYKTSKQKTEVKSASATIPDYTKVDKFPSKQGSKLTYGPFDEKPAGAVSPAQVRFEFAKPVTHVSELEREIEVSHWGGNVAFEEHYVLEHRGANLSEPFNRAKWTQSQYFNRGATAALKELRVPLQVGAADPYFTDVIGNVSTSRFRSNKREALLELKPRYPIFGGWKYPFTIGWNMDAASILRRTAAGGSVLKVPFLEGPKQAEGVEYGRINLRVLLPEGAENVKFFTDIPESSITETSVDLVKTYLDTVGRTSVTIKAVNLVDEFRDRHLIISYETTLLSSLRKPVVIFASLMTVYFTTWAIGNIKVGFNKK